MTLKFVEKPPAQSEYRFLLYGSPGSGKTTAALSAPGPILLINADRPTASRAARNHNPDTLIREVQFDGADTLRDVYLHIKEKKDDTKTVVLDTVGEAYKMLLDKAAGNAPRPSLAQYGDAQTIIDRWVRAMRDLPVNLVLVAREEIADDDDAGRIIRPETGGKKTPEVLMGQMDVVAYCAVVRNQENHAQYVAQLAPGYGRRAKDGSGVLGETRSTNVGQWISRMNGRKES